MKSKVDLADLREAQNRDHSKRPRVNTPALTRALHGGERAEREREEDQLWQARQREHALAPERPPEHEEPARSAAKSVSDGPSPLEGAASAPNNRSVCPICLDPPGQESQAVARAHECCGTRFCRDCLIFWAREKGKGSCPACRASLLRLWLEPDGTVERLRRKNNRTNQGTADYNAHGAAVAVDDDDDVGVVDDVEFRLNAPATCDGCQVEILEGPDQELRLNSCQCCGADSLCSNCLGHITAPGMRAPALACGPCMRSPPRRRIEPCSSAVWSSAAAERLEGRCDVCGDVGMSLHTCGYCGLEQVHSCCGQRLPSYGLTCGRCDVPWAMRIVQIRGSCGTIGSAFGAHGVAACASAATRTATASSSRINGSIDGGAVSDGKTDWDLWRMAEQSSSQPVKRRNKRKRNTSARGGSADRRSVVDTSACAIEADNDSTAQGTENTSHSKSIRHRRKRSR